MLRILPFALAALALVACSSTPDDVVPDAGGTVDAGATYAPLDEDTVTMSIATSDDGTQAAITATVTTATGAKVVLRDGQEIDVGATPLVGPDATGAYAVSIPSASPYTVKVIEPTHGTVSTNVTPPGQFSVSSTQFHITGGSILWSNAEAEDTVVIGLSQTFLGTTKTKSVNLASDTGSWTYAEADVTDFVSGAALDVRIVKTRASAELLGVKSAAITTSRTALWTVTPDSN